MKKIGEKYINSTDVKRQVLPLSKTANTQQPGKSSKELRKFGVTMAVAFGIFGGLFLWRDKSVWPHLFYLSGFFLFFGLALPRVLRPVEWAWMKMAQAVGYVMTRVILTVTFLAIITPLGLIRRLLNKDPLQIKFRRPVKSYWVAVKEDGPTSRPEKPY